jgi:D-arabinose 1-dehydrogenase-like Zn-dependent alcohol dehydrogenase
MTCFYFFFSMGIERFITMTTDLTASAILKEGNTAVITGASSGIGRAAAMYCASQGMNVWMADIDKYELGAAREIVEAKAVSSDQVRATDAWINSYVVNDCLLLTIFAWFRKSKPSSRMCRIKRPW